MTGKIIKDGGIKFLSETVNRIAHDDLMALDELLYTLPNREDIDPVILEIANSIGLIIIKLQAHEILLGRANDGEKRLEELNQIKNKYLGIAAHDLKNPLSAISGMSQALLKIEVEEAKQKEFLESISRISRQMLKLVDDLLDVSVIESGKFNLKSEEGNLADLCRERIELSRKITNSKGINLESDIKKVPNNNFDADRMRQVLDNLLGNAIKFSPPDTSITLRCEKIDQGIVVSVRDEGPGIPAKDQERIFDSFEKLGHHPTGGEKGAGLGLSIVKKIVDAHGGIVSLESASGKGSVFTVTLPI